MIVTFCMTPRLKSSNKWSSLPKELIEQITGIFSESFSSQLENAELKAEGRIYKEELILSIGFVKKSELRQTNFQASIQYDKSKENVLSLIHIAVDSIGSMFENYIKDPETDFPYTWNSFKVDEKEVFLMHSKENSDLEKKANELLNLKDDNLVKNSEDTDISPDKIKKSLGIKE